MKSKKRIILAYSGGLDTSIILKWLQENYNAEIICYTADIGKKAVMGALTLYLDFINLFIMLLRLFGQRR